MRPRVVAVPDLLWRDRRLTEGAKLLWCYLCARGKTRQFSFGELRKSLRISQNSLRKYLFMLDACGWLRHRKTGLRAVIIDVIRSSSAPAVRLPTDLLLDQALSRSAVWTWCVIHRHGEPFDYRWLQEATGYTQPTLSKHLRQLREKGWLVGDERRVHRRVEFRLQVSNPFELQRRADIAEIEQGIALARRTKGYSAGQYVLARMVQLRVAEGVVVVENAEVTGLDNLETGGRMHYDVLIPEYKLAIEFHGLQHFMPTERFPDPEAYRSQRRRDLIKRGRSLELGLTYQTVTAAELCFAQVDQLLAPHVPLRKDMGNQWHICDYLDRYAAHYRRRAAAAQ